MFQLLNIKMNLNISRTFMPVINRLPNEKTYDESDSGSGSSESEESTSSDNDSDESDGYSTTSSQGRDEEELIELLEGYVKQKTDPDTPSVLLNP